MARYLRIEGGAVVNAEEWDDAPAIEGVVYVQSDVADIGQLYDASSGEFSDPPPAPPVAPDEIAMTKVQKFLIQQGLLTAVTDYLNALPEPDRSMALVDWNRAPNFVTSSTLAQGAKGALGLTDDQYIAFCLDADALPA